MLLKLTAALFAFGIVGCATSHSSAAEPPTPTVAAFNPLEVNKSLPTSGYSGASSYAAMHSKFPCEAFLATEDFAPKPAMAVLWSFKGNDLSCIGRFSQRYRAKPHLLEIHIWDKQCRWQSPCFTDEKSLRAMSADTKAKIGSTLQGIKATIVGLNDPNLYVVISPLLESTVSDQAFTNLVNEIHAQGLPFPIARGGKLIPSVNFVEYHSSSGAPVQCIANEDALKDNSIKQTTYFLSHYKPCLARFIWRSAWQGIFHGKKIDPTKRNFVWTANDVTTFGNMLRASQ